MRDAIAIAIGIAFSLIVSALMISHAVQYRQQQQQAAIQAYVTTCEAEARSHAMADYEQACQRLTQKMLRSEGVSLHRCYSGAPYEVCLTRRSVYPSIERIREVRDG